MKSKLLIVGFTFVLWLQPLICSAQNQASVSRDVEALKWFDESANSHDPDLLFKALWYVGSPRAYQVLELYTTGMAYTYRDVPNWAIQASHSGILNTEQLSEIRQMLTEVKPPQTASESQEGQEHVAFVFLNEGRYVRYDFIGPSMPSNVERIIEKVSSEMSAEALRPDKNPKPDPTLMSHPCAKRDGDNLDLEAMAAKELLAYASRRSLLPLNRYRIVKCYFNKFPDVDNDDYMKYLKRWVERFEKAGK